MKEVYAIFAIAICAVLGFVFSLVTLLIVLGIRSSLKQRDLARAELYGKLRRRVSNIERFLVRPHLAAGTAKDAAGKNSRLPASDSRVPNAQ